jgi:hypothetical protein
MWVATNKLPHSVPGTRKWGKRAIDVRLNEISGLTTSASPQSAKANEFEEWDRRSKERDRYLPLFNLNSRLEKVLRFMIGHPESTTDVIPQAGERTMEALCTFGVVTRGPLNGAGQRTWVATEEGRAEVERIGTWTNSCFWPF